MNSTIIILLLLVLPFQREVVRHLIDSGADPEIKKTGRESMVQQNIINFLSHS